MRVGDKFKMVNTLNLFIFAFAIFYYNTFM